MKLIPLIIWMISLAAETEAHESFAFSPQYHGFESGMFSSDKQIYLPPESHTTLPYYPMKKFNNLPFPYLPSTITKSTNGTPSPFSIKLSSVQPIDSDEDEEDDEDQQPTPLTPYQRNQYNRTQRDPLYETDRREIRPILKKYQHPIDRIDTKLPIQFSTNSEASTQTSNMQSMPSRSIIISDMHRDQNFDQMKSPSFLGSQYIPQSGVFISTTETAVPILRLSNEMDLDGSFSYEALGADQTHYVQHSRMEHMGGDKEEQVVEGSYSYVGDNGKTYTVHYIADSNGFRASGEHLPVPPPVPEIIQRSVQYNLAEELKKPPHEKWWNDEQKENELSDSEKRNRFTILSPQLNNLFTGKSPQSFSHSNLQGSNTQNNIVAAASTQHPFHIIDFSDQSKQNSGSMSPQITIVASQGAHAPTMNTPQQQQNMFSSERPPMPLLVNYEANTQDSDNESNKQLWRWQYGVNANLNTDKNLISRSSGDNDISINFNDMTAEQYTKMLEKQLNSNMRRNTDLSVFGNSVNQGAYPNNFNINLNTKNIEQFNDNFNTVKPATTTTTASIDIYKGRNEYDGFNMENSKQTPHKTLDEAGQTSRPKLLTQDQFIPRSQIVTQSYNYDNDDFDIEARKTRMKNENINAYDMRLNVIPLSFEKRVRSNTTPRTNNVRLEYNFETQESSTTEPSNKIRFSDFIVHDDNENGFKPIISVTETQSKEIIVSTESNLENMLQENIFLKNLFKYNKSDEHSQIIDEKKYLQVKPIADSKSDNLAVHNTKYVEIDSKPVNEIKIVKRKRMDMADVMNYLSRNQFESARVKSKPMVTSSNKQKNEMSNIAADNSRNMAEDNNIQNLRTLQQQEELRGPIKNYKVLQRNNNFVNALHGETDNLKRNLSPPPARIINLPPLGRAGPTMKTYLPPVYV